ncbi:MAG: ATP-binding protein [Candidatus Methylomirabilales bacterium]
MINVNKLFRRLSIRSKLVIAFCLFGVVPVSVVGGYGAFHSFWLLNDAVQEGLKAGVAMKAEEIQRLLDRVKGDVLFLSRLPTLQALVNLKPEAHEERRRLLARLGEEFLSFSRSHPVYYQVRYIDERGREAVRADFDGQGHHLVPPDQLQHKGDRYYFREAMATPPGAIYVSPMDLNIEWGAVELPRKPVVRYAVPLRSAREEPRGIVILNIYASRILSHVLALGEKGEVSLASSTGFYLLKSNWVGESRTSSGADSLPFPSWLASYSEQLRPEEFSDGLPDGAVMEDYPSDLASAIFSGEIGTAVEPGLRGRIVAFAPIFPHLDRQEEFWVAVHAYRKLEVLSSLRALQFLVLLLGGAVLVVALVAGVAAARHFTRPITALIRGAEAVAAGDFDRPIRVETNDELEDLSHQFTQMATRLKEHERQLREARGRAERRAQETQALNRIGMEVLTLLSLPEILQLVVDKARELLKGDLAILCLDESDHGLRLGAVSGSAEALQFHPGDLIPALTCDRVSCQEARCPVVSGAAFGSHVGVVMRSEERVVGYLCVGHHETRPVGSDELEFLSGLANQATIAIEKARLHREVRELARLEERERIGQDLHDGIIQSIYATGLGLEECLKLVGGVPQEVGPKLMEAIQSLNVVIRDVRNYVVGLQPEELHGRGLSGALADLSRGLVLNALLNAELEVEPGTDEALSPDQAANLFQISREALTNVVKHAGASQVILTLRRADGVVCLAVEDDGAGFDPDLWGGGGQGLRNMGERARRLGGSLSVESAPGRGTRIRVEIPLAEPA